jgi:ABC-type glycerol-3-phosphate transport system substrate-binding protein
MKRKLFAILLVFLLVAGSLSMLSGCGDKKTSSNLEETNDGKTFHIRVWNEEFKERFKTYFEEKGLIPAGITVKWSTDASQDNVYQNKLDEALLGQKNASADDKVDLFLVEADYATKYSGTDYTLDVINDVGLTENDLKDQYQYTKDVVTFDGKIKGVSWQACPMGFMYRRSMAKAVLGTDDPTAVQEKLSSWAKFDGVAATMKNNGYYMLSGYDDDYRVFANNMTSSWVDGTKINIDNQIIKWIDQTDLYSTNGYNNKASLWSSESQQGMGPEGKVFGYFGPTWFMDFCFMDYTLADKDAPKEVGNGGYGDWGMVVGPQSGFWGGTWICGADGTDNIELVKKVMKTMTCDKETLVGITEEYGDFTNSIEAMTEIANDPDFGYAFLGGQNHIATLLESAKNIKMGTLSMYDQTMTEQIQKAFKDYYDGVVTKETAWTNFYTAVIEKHPELTR